KGVVSRERVDIVGRIDEVNSAAGCAFLPHTEASGGDVPGWSLCDISLSDEPDRSGAGADRFIDRQDPVRVEKRIAVAGRDAACAGEQAIDAGRDAADGEVVGILIADRAAREGVTRCERVGVVSGIDEVDDAAGRVLLPNAEAAGG